VAKRYSNENFPLPVVTLLEQRGHDVLTTVHAGRAGSAVPDEEVLRYAAQLGRAVLTLNRRDFIGLHLRSTDHAGIIACTLDADFSAQAERIARALGETADLKGRLLRINRQ
jgi:hypothetical protein